MAPLALKQIPLMHNGMSSHCLFLKSMRLLFYWAILILVCRLNRWFMQSYSLNCERIDIRIIQAEIATGVHKGKRVFIPRIIFTSPESELQFTPRRRQFPVRLAYCNIINKGQGQSLKTVGIFIPSTKAIFRHGQLYVGLCRVLIQQD